MIRKRKEFDPARERTVFDVIESAYDFLHDPDYAEFNSREATHTNIGYTATAFDTNKVRVRRETDSLDDTTKPLVRVHVIDVGYGIIRQVRFDSNNRAVYDIVLDQAVGPENDQSRDWVARREELEEIPQ